MSVAESYFAEEILAQLGPSAAETWLKAEIGKGSQRTWSSDGGSGASTPPPPQDEACSHGRAKTKAGEALSGAPAASRASSTSPRRLSHSHPSPLLHSPPPSPLPTSSDHVRKSAPSMKLHPSVEGDQTADDEQFIMRVLRSGSLNAGLIFTDAAHHVYDGDAVVEHRPTSRCPEGEKFRRITDDIFVADQLDNTADALSEVKVRDNFVCVRARLRNDSLSLQRQAYLYSKLW